MGIKQPEPFDFQGGYEFEQGLRVENIRFLVINWKPNK